LDVGATAILKANGYRGVAGYFHGVNESLEGGQTLPNSLYHASKPAFFDNLIWPPFNPANPVESYDAIPAGYRYNHPGSIPGGVALLTLNLPSVLPLNATISAQVPSGWQVD